ncbi:hypothetical protein [Prosthecomicrobium sp. N25]|uniref:hypothetical protein n=1 Tax=Prosthecomicrobium sp. N25 TaxID=3129254 RepID=UPI003077F213
MNPDAPRPHARNLEGGDAWITVVDREGRMHCLRLVTDRRPAGLKRIRPLTLMGPDAPRAVTFTIQ